MSHILVTLNDDVFVSAPMKPRGQASEAVQDTDFLIKLKYAGNVTISLGSVDVSHFSDTHS